MYALSDTHFVITWVIFQFCLALKKIIRPWKGLEFCDRNVVWTLIFVQGELFFLRLKHCVIKTNNNNTAFISAPLFLDIVAIQRRRPVCNQICVCRRRVAEHLEKALPNLETLILTNNSIHELGDLDVLSTITSLRVIRWGCVLYTVVGFTELISR